MAFRGLDQGLCQFADHLLGEGVAVLGAIEMDGPDGCFVADKDGLVFAQGCFSANRDDAVTGRLLRTLR